MKCSVITAVSFGLFALINVRFGYVSTVDSESESEIFHNNNAGCRLRNYGYGATVCVCNIDYCDSLAHVDLSLVSFPGSVVAYVTSKDGDRFRTNLVKLYHGKNHQKTKIWIKIDRNKQYQKILGFGGAFTDSAGINIDKLEPKLQERLIRDYYGPDGIEYSMGRIPIGGTDFSTRPYTYDDNAGFEDLELSKFQLQYEDLQFKIPFLQMASRVSRRHVKYMACSWSPPSWMKTNHQLNYGGNLLGNPGGPYYQLYAQYLVRFLNEYQNKHNISVWAMSMQNEPHIAERKMVINSMAMNATQQRDFLQLNFGPTLAQAGYQNMRVMIFEDNFSGMVDYVDTILSDPDASRYVFGIAFHDYHNYQYPNLEPLETIHRKYLGKYFILGTEFSKMLKLIKLGDWNVFDLYANHIIKDLNHWANGYLDWNMVLDPQGGPNWIKNFCDAPIIVTGRGTEYLKQPFFYALGHFSKFISPDSIRIGQTLDFSAAITNRSTIQATTFLRPDNRTVLTMLNMGSTSVSIQVQDSSTSFNSFQFTLKPKSLSSFIWY